MPETPENLSRRQVLAAAGGVGLLAVVGTGTKAEAATDGTPEQVHLTWGQDPATEVTASWASPAPAVNPRVLIDGRVIRAEQGTYIDGLNGETVWTYHARIRGLRPGARHDYEVTADNATTGVSA
jgi:hypothetical protein